MAAFYDFTMKKITGEDLPLATFKGQVVLVVNVASQCGYTPQYFGLQDLYRVYKSKGLMVLGVPCNQFGKQEPGTEEEIRHFCTTKYEVTFPMTGKVDVKGKNQHPLFAWLTNDEARYPGDVSWNFAKFLIGKDGQVLKRFNSEIEPSDDKIYAAIEAALN